MDTMIAWIEATVIEPIVDRATRRHRTPKWGDEWWTDEEHARVRQLYVDERSRDAKYRGRIAVRASTQGIELFVVSLSDTKRWATDRFSRTRAPDNPLRVDREMPSDKPGSGQTPIEETWQQGSRPEIAHAPNAAEIVEEFARTRALTIIRPPPFARPAVFECARNSERRKLKRLLDSTVMGKTSTAIVK